MHREPRGTLCHPSMLTLADRIIQAMQGRTAAVCVSCLTQGLVVGPPKEPPEPDFNRVMAASRDAGLGRSYGACRECGYEGVLLHPSP